MTIYTILILMGFSTVMFAFGVLLGGFLMFKGKSSQPNEKFLGGQAKGEVFSISDGLDEPEFPGAEEPIKAEKHLLKRTGDFLKTLSGGK